VSPFSTLQKYTLIAYPYTSRLPGNLTPWEVEQLEFLNQVGAASYFQLMSRSKHKKKLNTLSRAGLIRKYKLEGQTPMLVAASQPYSNVVTLLKALVFTQLVLTMRQKFEIEIQPGDMLLHAVLKINGNHFPVIVFRESDAIPPLPDLDRLIIISETFRPEFKKIKSPARIALDQEILSPLLTFYLPDGSKEVL
jgi:hypothetical protein